MFLIIGIKSGTIYNFNDAKNRFKNNYLEGFKLNSSLSSLIEYAGRFLCSIA